MPESPTCPVCREPLTGRPLRTCPGCSTSHHPECWRYAGGCATYACEGGEGARPEVRGPREFETPLACSLGIGFHLRMVLVLGAPAYMPYGVFSEGPPRAVFRIGADGVGEAVSQTTYLAEGILAWLVVLLIWICWELATQPRIEVDRAAGRLRLSGASMPGALGGREPRLEDLIEAGVQVRASLVSILRDTAVALELLVPGGGRRVRVAAVPLADWRRLRPFARGLAATLKTELRGDGLLAL